MKSVLVPVDFSKASANALRYAIDFFGVVSTHFTVLHVYGAKSTALVMKNVDHIFLDSARKNMNEFLSPFKDEFSELRFELIFTNNYAVDDIVEMGDTGDYDFIVMGTKGATGLKEVFMGSIAGGVVSKTKAPVIVVPGSHRFSSLREIVFAVGDDPFSKVEVLDPLRQIKALHQSEVKVLHIAGQQSSKFEDALAVVEDLDPAIVLAFGKGNTSDELNEYLATNDAGLLCLTRTKKGFLHRLLNESVTLKSTFHSPVPLLILHD